MGKAGQQASFFATGVPCVQKSRTLRRRGEEKMICRHLRQTCTSLAHFHFHGSRPPTSLDFRFHDSIPVSFIRHASNISAKTSSGSMLIAVPCSRLSPRPHRSMRIAKMARMLLNHTLNLDLFIPRFLMDKLKDLSDVGVFLMTMQSGARRRITGQEGWMIIKRGQSITRHTFYCSQMIRTLLKSFWSYKVLVGTRSW